MSSALVFLVIIAGCQVTVESTSDLIIRNYTSTTPAASGAQDITAFYVAPTADGSWGTDQLSANISAGGSYTISGIPCDQYVDVQATLALDGNVDDSAYADEYVTCGETMYAYVYDDGIDFW